MKLALCFDNHRTDHHEVVERMCRAQSLHPGHTYRIMELPGGAIGCVTTSDRFSAVPHLLTSQGGNLLVVSGVPLLLSGALAARLQQICNLDHDAAGDALSQLDGAFAALHWDHAGRKLTIVTDFLGCQPLYQHISEGVLLMATDIKGVMAAGGIDNALDPLGWGSFLSLGYFIDNRTSIQKVEIASPGTISVYDPRAGRLQQRSYWQWEAPAPELRLQEIDTGELVDQLEGHMRAAQEHNQAATLLLSGGFDSRLLLCTLLRAGITPRVMIHDHPDEDRNADGRYARAVAQRYGLVPEIITPSKGFFSSQEYLEFLSLNEMTTPSLNLFIAQLSLCFKQRLDDSRDAGGPGLQAIWEGVGPGNSLYPSIQTAGGFDNYFRLLVPSREGPTWRSIRTVFAPALADEMYDGIQDVLARERKKYPDDEYGVRYFIMVTRVRNRAAANPLKIYANYVLPFTPGLSRDFMNAVTRIPYHLKYNLDLYFKIFRDQFPAAMEVPWCTGGVLISTRGRMNPVHRIYNAIEKMGLIEKIKRYPLAEAAARKLGGQPGLHQRNPLVEKIINAVDPDHTDLNGEGIRRIKTGQLPRSEDLQARTMLFYWQMWRAMMSGQPAN